MSEWNNIERDVLIDEILSQVSKNKSENSVETNPSAKSSEGTLSRVDDILAEFFPKNEVSQPTKEPALVVEKKEEIFVPLVKETPDNASAVPSKTTTTPEEKAGKPEKEKKKRKKKEENDVLSKITPWDERRKMHEGGESDSFEDMAGHKKATDFYSDLKNRASVEQENDTNEKGQDAVQTAYEILPEIKEEIIVKKHEKTAKVSENKKDITQDEEDVKIFEKEKVKDILKDNLKDNLDDSINYDFEPTKFVPAVDESSSFKNGTVESETIVMDSLPSEPKSEIQFKLPGFEKTPEDTIKGEFVKRRRVVIEQFEVNPDALPSDEPINVKDDEDYHGIEDAESMRLDLLLRSRQVNNCHMTTVVLAIISTVLTLCALPGVAVFNMDEIAELHLAINLICMLVAIIVNAKTIFGGIMGLLRKNNSNGTVGASLAMLVGFIINAVLFAFVSDFSNSGLPLFNFLYLWAFSFALAGEKANINRIRTNFELIANEKEKTAVSVISGGKKADDIAQGLAMGVPEVAVTKKGIHLENFLYHSLAQDEGDKSSFIMSHISLPLALICGLLCFFFAGENYGEIVYSLTAFSGATVMLIPFVGSMAGGKVVESICRVLRREKIMASGYDVADMSENVNVIALNAADLFPVGTVKLTGVKTASTQAIDRSIQDIAAVMIADGGPLSYEFKRIVEDKLAILPKVEAPVYEEGMGISGWVSGKRVLVGNKALMEHHEIRLPNYDFEGEAEEKGLSSVYLSTEGRFAAVFFVKYTANRKVAEYLKKAVNKGMSINVCSNDPFINHEMLCRLFSLPSKSVKLMDTTARKAYKNALNEEENLLSAVMMHIGNAGSTARLLSSGKNMKKLCKYIALMQYILTALAMIISCVCILTGGAEALGIFVILVHYIISLLLAWGIPSLTIK